MKEYRWVHNKETFIAAVREAIYSDSDFCITLCQPSGRQMTWNIDSLAVVRKRLKDENILKSSGDTRRLKKRINKPEMVIRKFERISEKVLLG